MSLLKYQRAIGRFLINAPAQVTLVIISPIRSRNAQDNQLARKHWRAIVPKGYSIQSTGEKTPTLRSQNSVLSSHRSCKNELAECTSGSSLFDARNLTAIWHEACDDKISFSVTTPVLLTPTASFVATPAATAGSSVLTSQDSATTQTSETSFQSPPNLPSSAGSTLSTSSPSTGNAVTIGHSLDPLFMFFLGILYFY
jgi:hypothetical protein